MKKLFEKKCISCEGNISAFDYSEIHKYLKKVNDWEVKEDNKKNYLLEKKFKFKNFLSSQKFINLIGDISEKKVTILILVLVGVMLKLKFVLMQLMVCPKMILF